MSDKKQKNIPDEWRYERLGNVSNVITGCTPDTKCREYYGGDYMFVSPSDLRNKYVNKTEKTLTESGFLKCRNIPKGAVLFTCIGSTIGKIGIAGENLATNQQINAVVGTKADTNFIYYQLLLRAPRIKLMAGLQAVPIINKSLFESVDLLVAPILEQKRIVAVLETWDRYLEKLERKIAIKKNIKKGLMQQLLTGKKRLKGFSGEWNIVALGDLGKTYSGLTGKDKNDFGFGKPFVSYMNIYSNPRIRLDCLEYVDIKENENQNFVKYGDLFFTTSSETAEEVGISSVLLEKHIEKIYLNSFCFGFRLFNFSVLIPKYACFYFRGQSFRKSMFRIAQGASRYNLSKKYFLKVEVLIPRDLKEQRAIAGVLTKSDEEIETLEQKKKIIEAQKKFLLNNLITGKIRTPENMKV